MTDFKYRTFISYSHKDEKWAKWLHRELESYRPPAHLVGKVTQRGPIPKRLAPVFRDRDELASATDLGSLIREALAGSACQIVICSPDAARSRWVNEEILEYKRLGREDSIFCLIVAGEPNASYFSGRDLEGMFGEECFPEALRYRIGPDGNLSSQRTEPIAADARPGKDGRQNAKLKLIAGLLGVGFDEIRQREQQRRQRRLALIASASTVGMIVTAGLAVAALFARAEAERQRARAEGEAETARQTTDFLVGLFEVSDPSEARGNSITAREILQRGASRIATELNAQPAVQARLMDTIGTVYRNLGLYGDAQPLLEESLARSQRLYGPLNENVAKTTAHLAALRTLQGDYAAANESYETALETIRQLRGDESEEVAEILESYADLMTAEGRFPDAERTLRESMTIRRKLHGEGTTGVAGLMHELGMNLYDQGRYAEAEKMVRDSLDLQRKLLGDSPHPDVAETINNLSLVLLAEGKLEDAEQVAREAVDMNRKLLGDSHPTLAISLNNLAFVLHEQGNYAAAEPLYREVLAMRRRLLGDKHTDIALSLNNLAFLVHDKGDVAAGLSFAEQSLAMYQSLFPGDHPEVARGMINLGGWLIDDRSYARAERLLRDGLAMNQRLLKPDHPDIANSLATYAILLLETRRPQEALDAASNARGIFTATLGAQHWRTGWAGSLEGAALMRLGKLDEAQALLDASVAALNDNAVPQRHRDRAARFLAELQRQRVRMSAPSAA